MTSLDRFRALLHRPLTPPLWPKVRSALGAFSRKLPRILRWSIRGVGVLMVLATATWIVLSMVSCSRLESAIQEFRSDPTLKDPLMDSSRQVPPNDNGAPHFSAAFALLDGLGKPPGDLTWVANRGWGVLSEPGRLRLRKWLDSAEEAFNMAERGAKKPRCVFERPLEGTRWRMPLLEVGKVGWLTGALTARGRILGSEGKPEEARRHIALAFAVADCLREDPFLPSQMIRASWHEQVCRAIPEAIGKQPTAKDLEEWTKVVPAPERFDGALELGFRGDAFAVLDTVDGSLGQYWEAIRWFPVNTPNSLIRRLHDPWARFDGAKAVATCRRMIPLCRRPPAEAWIEAMRIRTEIRRQSDFPSWVSRHLSNFIFHLEKTRAVLLVTRAGLEFERIHTEMGRYPDRCEIIDSFTGKPLLLESGPARLATAGPTVPGEPSRTFIWILRGK
jgi:hypothetical protein